MEISKIPAQNQVHRRNIGCEFCPQVFDEVADKNAHVLEHFEQEICTKCDQNLLRIGGNLYVLHGTITCVNIKQETISDEPEEAEFSSVINQKVDAAFQTGLEYSGEIDEFFEEKREFNEVINPLENVELSPIAPFELNFSKLPDINEGTNSRMKSQDISVDEIKLEINDDSDKFRSTHLAQKHSVNSLTTHNDGGKFGCDKCGSENLTHASIRRHHLKPSLVCSECGQAFCKRSQLKEHYKNHLGAIPYDGIDTMMGDRTECGANAQNQVKITECPIEESGDCEGRAPVRQSILNKRIKRYKCPIEGCDELVSSNNRSFHLASKHKTTQFECDICKKTFVGLFQIRRHMSVHGAKCKRYTCKLCGKSNLTKRTVRRYHNSQNFECPLCKERFCQKTALKMHHVDEHCGGKAPPRQSYLNRNIKRLKCPVEGCNELLSRNNRQYHIATKHTKKRTKEFECDICRRTFSTKSVMKSHILSVHVPSSKKFKCDLCESAFLTQSSLGWHHKLVHVKERNFMCSECGKTFVSTSHLKIHLTKHTGEKQYACTFDGCSKRFRTHTGRWEHSRSHTGEKPYCCDVGGCDRRFAFPVDVKRHKFSAHGIYFKKYPCQICSKVFPENMLLKKHMKKHENQI